LQSWNPQGKACCRLEYAGGKRALAIEKGRVAAIERE
jgi:hypothetical protein